MSAAAASISIPNVAATRPAINPWIVAIVVTLATFMELLDTAIANVSLPHIAGGLAVSYDESTWVLTSYLVSNAVVLPLSAWLSRVFGRKRVLVHREFAVVWIGAQLGAADFLPSPTGRWRWRSCAGRASHSGRHIPGK